MVKPVSQTVNPLDCCSQSCSTMTRVNDLSTNNCTAVEMWSSLALSQAYIHLNQPHPTALFQQIRILSLGVLVFLLSWFYYQPAIWTINPVRPSRDRLGFNCAVNKTQKNSTRSLLKQYNSAASEEKDEEILGALKWLHDERKVPLIHMLSIQA